MTQVKQPKRSHPVRVYRISRMWSQVDLAKAAGVARTTIMRIEAGTKPTLRTANAIANVLGAPVEALFPPEEGDDAPF